MGGSASQVFHCGSALLSNSLGHKISESTRQKINTIFDALRENPNVSLQRLEALLLEIPKYENILAIHDEAGYNLLQKCVGLNHVDLIRWILTRHNLDVNRSACSLPLHIACLKGYEECVELLLRHGARIDKKARMCFPGPHSHNCKDSDRFSGVVIIPTNEEKRSTVAELAQDDGLKDRPTSKLQDAVLYALDGDQVGVLNILVKKMEEKWWRIHLHSDATFRIRKPLLHLACERGAWNCVQHLVTTRSDEIHVLEYEDYPVHKAVLHDIRFLELLIKHGADTNVKTCTQRMTVLHVVLLLARKSAEDTLNTISLLLKHSNKDLINTPDVLGNTPLHAVIIRYILEHHNNKWSKEDILHLVLYLLEAGAKLSLNRMRQSALALALNHVRDSDVCYELLNMLSLGGEPNRVGRDGSMPIMVCRVPLSSIS